MDLNSTPFRSHEVRIPADGVELPGDLTIPEEAIGLVIFAHGSGSSRHSPRNRSVADLLREHGLATLLFDLLTDAEGDAEERGAQRRFDIPFLTARLIAATRYAEDHPAVKHLRIGYFGASTGAAAALSAAAQVREIAAIVSRGGRSDLADPFLAQVNAPVLFIAGGLDPSVIGWNRQSLRRLSGYAEMEIIAGADHLFSQPGALDEAAALAAYWLARHL